MLKKIQISILKLLRNNTKKNIPHEIESKVTIKCCKISKTVLRLTFLTVFKPILGNFLIKIQLLSTYGQLRKFG